jgi:diguanylate cyclase (GGDEF)-like protein
MSATRTEQQQPAGTWRARSVEFARELGVAALECDDALVARRLSELLRIEELPPAQTRALQLRTLTELIGSLRCAAITDDLTGLYNRRGFFQCGTRLLEAAARDRESVRLVYFDLNNLKEVNDTAGHAAGDALLEDAAGLLRDLFPGHGVDEILARLGGDEFAALTTGPRYATQDAMLAHLAQGEAACVALPSLTLSFSWGVACFNPRCPVDLDTLLGAAERAMYQHKRSSRSTSASSIVRLSRTASTDQTPLAV